MLRLGAHLEDITREGQISSVYGIPMYEKVDLQAMIEEAVAAGKQELTLPRGAYRIWPKENKHHLCLSNLENFTLHAEGVIALCQDLRGVALMISSCKNVTVEGLTIDYEPYGYAQMKVEYIDPDGQYVDVHIDNGYFSQFADNEYKCPYFPTQFYDGKTRRNMHLRPFTVSAETVKEIGDRRFRITSPLADDHKKRLCVGDYITASMRPVMRGAITLYYCEGVRLQNMRVHAGCTGLSEVGSEGKNYYNALHVIPGPRPYASSEERICSTVADAFHMQNNRVGATIENCIIHSAGDDGANFYGLYSRVMESLSPTALIIGERSNVPIRTGDILRFYRGKEAVLGEAEVEGCEKLEGYEADPSMNKSLGVVTFRPSVFYRVTLKTPVETAAGDWCNDTSHVGNGFVLRNNFYCNLRPRGALIKASHGLIENCIFEDIGKAGVQIRPELNWGESGCSNDVIVRGNTFINCGDVVGYGVTVEGECAPDQRNILIEDNRFIDCPYEDIHLTSCIGVTVRNNRLGLGNRKINAYPRVRLVRASDVTLTGNTVAAADCVAVGAGELAEDVKGTKPATCAYASAALATDKQGTDGWHFGCVPIGTNDYREYTLLKETVNSIVGWYHESGDAEEYGCILRLWDNSYMKPGEKADCYKAYVCPKPGRVRFAAHGTLITGEPTEDGVHLAFLRGDELLWEKDMLANELAEMPVFEADVQEGETFYFRVNKRGNAKNDGLNWAPTALYVE